MRYAFIDEQRTQHPVRRMCELLEVSSAGYYEWRGRELSPRAQADITIGEAVVRAHAESRKTYGRPRIHAELSAQGFRVGQKRVARIMKAHGLVGVMPRAFRKTTDSAHALPVALNVLDRNFGITKIDKDKVWAGDITYLATREGWLYLAVILDLFSRRVVGWSMGQTMQRELVIDALNAAIGNRRPKAGVLFHSDRGSQYASNDFQSLLNAHGMTASMSGKGQCWDNACVESFFGSMKRELGDPIWESRDAVRQAIFEYIEVWYNRKRRHSTLGFRSPEEYESSLPIAA
jgi:transposase InsO family protein